MKKKYSILSILKNTLSHHEKWEKMWRNPEPKKSYEAIIIGGGGHGLGTAYYLAKEHGIKNIAVIEKGWLGSGNTGRNTTIIRSNYLWNESAFLYDHSLKLWENLSSELNYNVMFSQRGVMNLAHNEHDIKEMKRRISANKLNGLDSRWISKNEIKKLVPIMNTDNLRYPVLGAAFQPRGGVARHDAVAWGFAMRADEMGVEDEAIASALSSFQGIARRFEVYPGVVFDDREVLLVDDYGHHPREIAATFDAIRAGWPDRRLLVAFQPHRYTRTRDLFDDFTAVLSKADVLLIAEVYPAGERPISGADGRALCRGIRSRGMVDPIFVLTIEELQMALDRVVEHEDLVLFLGAGNIGGVASDLSRAPRQRSFDMLDVQDGPR